MNQNEYPNSRSFPIVRLRRLRRTKAIRDLLQETRISVKDLIYPIFVQEGITEPKEIESMPGFYRLPLKSLTKEVEYLQNLGISSFILFGIPSSKDRIGSSAYSDEGIVQEATRVLRKNFSDKIVIISDVCLCQYTDHGHCGIVKSHSINNDLSLDTLGKIAVSHARAGVDFVAPSAMMDGQVKKIRASLDSSDFDQTGIIGYSAKFSSNLYTPFRDAAHSIPDFGDRKSYQMSFFNTDEAMQEIELDIQEGADIIMIKPALPFLDLIYRTKKRILLPICAYSVSGEYSIVKAAASEGWISEDDVVIELIASIKRSGADMIISYHAKKMAEILSNQK